MVTTLERGTATATNERPPMRENFRDNPRLLSTDSNIFTVKSPAKSVAIGEFSGF
jgi:hypothetical protein